VNNLVTNETGHGTDLVARIEVGDLQAEAELVERYSHNVKIIIRREVSDAMTIDDLYQETFRIVLEKIRQGDVREPERLSGFVRSVAKNLIIAYFRQAARQVGMSGVEEIEPLPNPGPDQLEEFLQKETADLVRQILRSMPNQRDIQVLFRFYLAEDDKEKICADLGMTILHFNVVLQRARERFRKLYKRVLDGK
jgi:RNA polymerase sigma-70 factor, ECF subfamily